MAFGTYPALNIRQPDLGKTLITAAYLKSAGLKNRLMEGKLRKQKTVQGLGAQIMSGGGMAPSGGMEAPEAGFGADAPGAQAGRIDPASPEMRALIAADPEAGQKYLNLALQINEAKDERQSKLIGISVRLLKTVLNASEEERALLWPQVRATAEQQGVASQNMPSEWDEQWALDTVDRLTAVDAELAAIERKAASEGVWVQTAKRKTWMRKDRLEGVTALDAPTEAPALVQIADAYRRASEKAGKSVSLLAALRWAKSSVGKSPQDIFVQVYTALVRGLMDTEEARSTADEITQYVAQMQIGGGEQAPAAGAVGLGLAGPAQAAGAPGEPLASVTQIQGGLGPGEQAPYPGRKPSLAGVDLPLPPDTESPLTEIEGPKRPLPRNAQGKVDAARLIVGQTYEAADLTLWRWDGATFTEVTE